MEIVVEDMERIDFAKFEDEDTHLSDWRFERDEDYAVMRYKYDLYIYILVEDAKFIQSYYIIVIIGNS